MGGSGSSTISSDFLIDFGQESDTISLQEIHWLFRKYYPNISVQFSVLLMKLIDQNSDGIIQRSEFEWVKPIIAETAQTEDGIFNLIFQVADRNGNGVIEPCEYAQIVAQLQLKNCSPTIDHDLSKA